MQPRCRLFGFSVLLTWATSGSPHSDFEGVVAAVTKFGKNKLCRRLASCSEIPMLQARLSS